MSATVIVETLRRHFAHLGYVISLLLLIVINAMMAALGSPMASSYQLISLFSLISGSQLIGPEFSSGTLQLILSKPINRSAYLLSRFTGVVAAICVAAIVVFGSDALGRVIAGVHVDWRVALGALVTTALDVVLTCALLTLFGSFTRSYVNVAIYLGTSILMGMVLGLLGMMKNAIHGELAAVGAFLRAHPGIISAINTVHDNLFPNVPMVPFDRNWMIMMLCNASVALLLACIVFSRREVPYGAD